MPVRSHHATSAARCASGPRFCSSVDTRRYPMALRESVVGVCVRRMSLPFLYEYCITKRIRWQGGRTALFEHLVGVAINTVTYFLDRSPVVRSPPDAWG